MSNADATPHTERLWVDLSLPDEARTWAPGQTLGTIATPIPWRDGNSSDGIQDTVLALDPSLEADLAGLPRLTLSRDDAAGDLRVLDELGRGGMGIVLRARQASLGREVAVKRLRRNTRHQAAIRALLDEARVVGALEHPNIVPIHALGTDADGDPTLVMKRVEGAVWDDLLHDRTRPQVARSGAERLRWHLEILMQVCQAVEFAHSRGIAHRDLKPSNVMIGEYGEVYVLDWGLAYELPDADAEPTAGRVGRRHAVVGTPAYLAPEMLRSDAVTERTDVYLLGAVLHEVLTGRTRHEGETFFDLLPHIIESPPAIFDDAVPEELAAICNRAAHRDPGERFPSVRALRDAIAQALEHRTSRELTDEALASLEELRALAGERHDEPHALWARFWECRIGFRKALQRWDGNERARAGSQECLRVMVAARIAQRDELAARGLLGELELPDPELEAQLSQLARELAEERARVEQLEAQERHRDLSVLSRSRAIQLVWMTAMSLVLAAALLATVRLFGYPLSYAYMLPMCFVPPLITVVWQRLWARGGTQVNRQLMSAFLVIVCFATLSRVAAWVTGLPVERTFVFEQLCNTLGVALVAVLVDRRLVGPTGLCVLCSLGALAAPDRSLEWLILGTFGGMAWAAAIWYRAAEAEARAPAEPA